MNCKVIDTQVNLCDSNLIGKELNNTQVSKHFYGEEMSEGEIINALKKAALINALGPKAVALVQQVKGKLEVIEVQGIPHVEFFLIS